MIWIPTLETLLSARVLRKKEQSRKLKEQVQIPKKALIARERKTHSNPSSIGRKLVPRGVNDPKLSFWQEFRNMLPVKRHFRK